MVSFCVQRRDSILVPITPSDEIELRLLPLRRVFSVEIHPKAPLKLSRWYRAGLQLLTEATGRWASADLAHREIMFKSGYVDQVTVSTGGDVRITPISQAGWDLVEWRIFLDHAMPIMLEFAGETRAQFRDRVDRFFGLKYKEVWEG